MLQATDRDLHHHTGHNHTALVTILVLTSCSLADDELAYYQKTGHQYVDTGRESDLTIRQRVTAGTGLEAAEQEQRVAIEQGALRADDTGVRGTLGSLFADRMTCEVAIDVKSSEEADALARGGKVLETVEYFGPDGRPETRQAYMSRESKVGLPTGTIVKNRTTFMKIREEGRCAYIYVLDGKYAGKHAWVYLKSID